MEKPYTPKLTIVMPFFNQKEMVAEMVDSILANDFQEWELLAIDDGSEQETLDHLKRYEEDRRIHIIRRIREPKGAQTCRNMGLEMARGEYIVFFDSDDFIAPYCLQNRINAIEHRPDLDFMVFPSGTYNDGVFRSKDSHDLYGYPIYSDDLAAFLKRTLPFIVWNNIYRTESIRNHHLTWDTKLLSLQDSDFNIQSLLSGMKYAYVMTKPDYGYRTATNSSSISKKISSEKHRESHLYFIDKQYKEIQMAHKKSYNHALYQGVLYLFSATLAEGVVPEFSRQLAEIVFQHDHWHGVLLRTKNKACLILGKFLPPKLSRQLPMPIFLIRKRLMERVIIPKQISKMIKEKE